MKTFFGVFFKEIKIFLKIANEKKYFRNIIFSFYLIMMLFFIIYYFWNITFLGYMKIDDFEDRLMAEIKYSVYLRYVNIRSPQGWFAAVWTKEFFEMFPPGPLPPDELYDRSSIEFLKSINWEPHLVVKTRFFIRELLWNHLEKYNEILHAETVIVFTAADVFSQYNVTTCLPYEYKFGWGGRISAYMLYSLYNTILTDIRQGYTVNEDQLSLLHEFYVFNKGLIPTEYIHFIVVSQELDLYSLEIEFAKYCHEEDILTREAENISLGVYRNQHYKHKFYAPYGFTWNKKNNV